MPKGLVTIYLLLFGFLAMAGVEEDAKALRGAFLKGQGKKAITLLRHKSAEDIEALKDSYFSLFGKDLEYAMRGWSRARQRIEWIGLSHGTARSMGEDLAEGLSLLHTPKLKKFADRIIELVQDKKDSTSQGRQEIYGFLALLGGEERELLFDVFQKKYSRSLVETLIPILESAILENSQRKIESNPKNTVAVIVSSGNWKAIADGATGHIGGYHWREIEAYVDEAIARGFAVEFFTPYGLPASPDAASLLRGKVGPQLGFGLLPGKGPDSAQGKVILSGLSRPRPLSSFASKNFASVHIAGGHGAHLDLVGNPLVLRAAAGVYFQKKIISAVCHATPALGYLLTGGPATAFSPHIDSIMSKKGLVLPEFIPTYDAHQGLRNIGANVDPFQAFYNIHHTETFFRDGVTPIITGTGPEATDEVARKVFDWIADSAK